MGTRIRGHKLESISVWVGVRDRVRVRVIQSGPEGQNLNQLTYQMIFSVMTLIW